MLMFFDYVDLNIRKLSVILFVIKIIASTKLFILFLIKSHHIIFIFQFDEDLSMSKYW